MAIEIVSIGNELLSGSTLNTNAATIGRALLSHGFAINRVTLLPDEASPLKEGIKETMERSAYVITTGGLGPTGDDITRDVIADLVNRPLICDHDIKEDLVKRFTHNLSTLEDQSKVPLGSTILHNPIGTAPGFILTNSKSTIIALPGVPEQMEVMLNTVTLYLAKRCPQSYYVTSLYLCQLLEEQVDPLLRTFEREHPSLQIGICPSLGTLSVFIRAHDSATPNIVKKQIVQSFPSYVFSTTSQKIEDAVQEWMVTHGKTLVCAESCTGGHLSARLTAISGASNYFLGGVVSYSNALKISLLHVLPVTLQSYGAVSREVVMEMAQGALTLAHADYALAISGIAGPHGGSNEKPIGTIWGAIATKTEIFTGKFRAHKGAKRRMVIEYSATRLLSTLWRYLQHNIEPFS